MPVISRFLGIAIARAHVLEWLMLHRPELLEDWKLAKSGEPLKPIAPLE